jgi:hypothetical protein
VSRRKPSPKPTHHTYVMLQVVCREDPTHHVGKLVRQRGREMIGKGLERVDGPNGETKILSICPVCHGRGSKVAPQIRWDRIQAIFDDMERVGEHLREITGD